jgi:hypothetical protein
LRGRGDYVFGVLLVAVDVPEEDAAYYNKRDYSEAFTREFHMYYD